MRTFKDHSLPLAIGAGVGVLGGIYGYSTLKTLLFVTAFYCLWRLCLWRTS